MFTKYFNTEEAAVYTGLSESYLAKLRMGTMRDPGPRFIRIGIRAIRYRYADLDEWMEERIEDDHVSSAISRA